MVSARADHGFDQRFLSTALSARADAISKRKKDSYVF